MNTYQSIVPSEMSKRDLRHMCTELTTAKNWGKSETRVKLANGQEYDVEVSRLPDYQQAHRPETGALKV